MDLIKIARMTVRKFSEACEIKKYRIHDSDSILMHDYIVMHNKIRINNRK
ncbi:hypothetical protein HY637_01335 [Candidatus Woesearchaeota archaeon]|nr:hypothetical protein [Candidatus Woesearchaeota archaeon]